MSDVYAFDALDDFAGPGGWDEGARMIGLTTLGVEHDATACATAEAAGHSRVLADVAAHPTPVDAIRGDGGYIASPPCQAWSAAGHRKGELQDRDACHRLAERMRVGDDRTDWHPWADERSALVCQPIRRVRELRPEWIALEEVPAVLGLWHHFAAIYRAWGYTVWVGILNAADYGVPQRRRRAILMGHRRGVTPPPPTHTEHPQGADLFGTELQPWVSMADALGWGFDREPAATVSGGGTGSGGGAEPFAGAEYRERLSAFVAAGVTGQGRPRDPQMHPADTITGKGTAAWVLTADPARTSVRLSVGEAAALQSFPLGYPWQGNTGEMYQQVGNAVPPLLAAHVLAALTGRPAPAVEL